MTQTAIPASQPIHLLRLPAVLERRGCRESQHHDDVRDGLFVKPIKRGPRLSLYPDFEVDAIVRAEIAGRTPAEIRQLVAQLESARKTLAS